MDLRHFKKAVIRFFRSHIPNPWEWSQKGEKMGKGENSFKWHSWFLAASEQIRTRLPSQREKHCQ